MNRIRKTAVLLLAGTLLCAQPAAAETLLSDHPLIEENAEGEAAASEAGTAETAQPAASAAAVSEEVLNSVEKPSPASEAAVLYDATAKQLLFAKNPEQSMYPASITKIMTVLLAAEKCGLSETVEFSASATQNLESGYTNVQMTAGDSMTVQDALYAVMLKSACEVSNALAEKVSGTQSAFASLMNQKAAALGCKNTTFKNASGLNDRGHVTTAYDMALIAAAAFSNQTVRIVCSTKSYTLPASKNRGSLKLSNSNKMLYSANAEYFEGIVGGKTGYTSKAGNTLVEVADVNGHELIAVVMKSTGKHYSDAKKLLTYGKEVLAAAAGSSAGTAATVPAAASGSAEVTVPAAASGSTADAASAEVSVSLAGSSSGQALSTEGGTWETTSAGRRYLLPSGKYASSGWTSIDGEEYYFGADGIAAAGWRKFTNGTWYYFEEETGRMVHDRWVSTDGTKYFYLSSDGSMAVNTWIDGKYRVDENGVYVEKAG